MSLQQQHHSSSRRRHFNVKRNRGWMAMTTCCCILIISCHWNTSLAFTRTIQQKQQLPMRRHDMLPLSFTQPTFKSARSSSSSSLPILHLTNNDDSPTPKPKRPKKSLHRLALPLLLTILSPLPTLAMGPNLRGPVIEKEVRGMERARIMAAEKARADAIAEKQRFDAESSRIYREKGPKAHAAFLERHEKEVEERERRRVEEREALIERLVCDEGMNPWRSLKGKAVLYEFDTGIDLYEVPGTEQEAFSNLARVFPEKYDGKMEDREREKMLEEVKVMEEEGKSRGEIVMHFKREGEKLAHFMNTEMGRETMKLRALREKKRMAQKGNVKKEDKDVIAPTKTMPVEEAGEAETPQEEAPAAAAGAAVVTPDKDTLKEEMKRKKQQAKADAKAARDKKREEAREAKKLAAEAKKIAAEAKAAKKLEDAQPAAIQSPDPAVTTDEDALITTDDDIIADETPAELPTTSTTAAATPLLSRRGPKLVAASTVIAGSGLVTIRMMKQNAQKKEEERQKQFKLLMGIDNDNPPAAAATTTTTTTPAAVDTKPTVSPPAPSPPVSVSSAPPPSPPKTKKKRGLGSIFRPSSTSTRPTSLPDLLSSSTCPPLSHLLSQILSSQGAPGRFPSIPPPSESYPTLDDAANALTRLREEHGLSVERTGDMFADVVSCLIIEIIDLAAGALTGSKKEEEEEGRVVVEGMNVVLDFMDYAAGLFGLVAPDVTLSPPVTYGGSLSKSKLERMYALYATAAMTSLSSSDSDRVDILQQVLNISDKRSEALMQKFMMKNLMKMMKDGGKGMMGGEGGDMGGLAEMMKGLEGMGEGMGDDFEMGEEDIKQSVAMMKQLVDSGSITKEEIGLVKEQFQQAYGEDIEDLIKQADEGDVDELGEDGKELLDLFKTVLKED